MKKDVNGVFHHSIAISYCCVMNYHQCVCVCLCAFLLVYFFWLEQKKIWKLEPVKKNGKGVEKIKEWASAIPKCAWHLYCVLWIYTKNGTKRGKKFWCTKKNREKWLSKQNKTKKNNNGTDDDDKSRKKIFWFSVCWSQKSEKNDGMYSSVCVCVMWVMWVCISKLNTIHHFEPEKNTHIKIMKILGAQDDNAK